MRQLALTPKFKRAHAKLVRHHREYQRRIEETLTQMEKDVFSPKLGTHKLSGRLSGLWACTCGFDCRIIFALEKYPPTSEEVIVLLDIGTHHEVY